MRRPDTRAHQQIIGYEPGAMPEHAAQDQQRRAALTSWLTAHGLNATRAANLTPRQAVNAYNSQQFLAALLADSGDVIADAMTPEDDLSEQAAGIRLHASGIVLPDWYDLLIRCVEAGRTVALVGPTGCGKTLLGRAALEDAFFNIHQTEIQPDTMPQEIIGSREFNDGHMGFSRRVVVNAFEDPLGALLIDEYDNANPAVSMALQSALHRGKPRMLAVPAYIERNGRIQSANPNMPIILTMNTVGLGPDATYVSRQRIDEANRDRLTIFTVGYNHEGQILASKGYPRTLADRLEVWAKKARNYMAQAGYRHPLSTRRLIDIASSITELGMSHAEAIDFEFFSRLPPDDASEIKRKVGTP